METYKVLGEIDGLEIGSVVGVNMFEGSEVENYLADGRLELVSEESDSIDEDTDTVPSTPSEDSTDEKVEDTVPVSEDTDVLPASHSKSLEGQEIISDSFVEVNGTTYHCVKLADGSTQNLTDEEYALKVVGPDNG